MTTKPATSSTFRPPARVKLTKQQLAATVLRERREANARGREWTEWRKFHSNEEAEAPARCFRARVGFRPTYCRVIATYVTYHSTNMAYTYVCSGCFEEEAKRQKADRNSKPNGTGRSAGEI